VGDLLSLITGVIRAVGVVLASTDHTHAHVGGLYHFSLLHDSYKTVSLQCSWPYGVLHTCEFLFFRHSSFVVLCTDEFDTLIYWD